MSGVQRTLTNDVAVTGAIVDFYQAKLVLRSLADVLNRTLVYPLCLE
jgi:hypothetical protein